MRQASSTLTPLPQNRWQHLAQQGIALDARHSAEDAELSAVCKICEKRTYKRAYKI